MRQLHSRLRIFIVATAAIVVAGGCGSSSLSSEQRTSAATPVSTVTAPAMATPTSLVSASPVDTLVNDATPTIATATIMDILVVALRDMRDLTWGSSMIVHGTVVEKLPSAHLPALNGPLGTETPQGYYDTQIYTDYVINVDQVFRGVAPDNITLREMGGQINGVSLDATSQYPDLQTGDDLVLFLVHWDDALWATGLGQGVWIRNGDAYTPYHSQFTPLNLDEIRHAVADALQQGPPNGLPLELVPLDQSPPGPDLPES